MTKATRRVSNPHARAANGRSPDRFEASIHRLLIAVPHPHPSFPAPWWSPDTRWEFGILPSRSVWPGWFGPTFAASGLLIAVAVVALTWSWLLPRRFWLATAPGESTATPDASGTADREGNL